MQSLLSKIFIFCILCGSFNIETVYSVCVPAEVQDLSLSSKYVLSWKEPLNLASENCSLSGYIIYVQSVDEETQQFFETNKNTTTLDVSFMQICENYQISVYALTVDHVVGKTNQQTLRTPPTSDMSLNITIDSIVTTNTSIYLNWTADSRSEKCISSYRLVSWDEEEDPQDTYVTTKEYTLADPVPCMKYEFQVRAIVDSPEVEGPFSLVARAAVALPTNSPILASISTNSSSAQMVWKIQSYDENRCQIQSILVKTTPNVTTTYPITDDPSRPPVTITITKLDPDTVYLSQVAVVNSAGTSKAVSITYQTTSETDKY